MAVKMIPTQCPSCGAQLEIEEGRTQIFCTYCGSKIIIQNDNEYVYRTVDEAEVKKAETERLIKLKELELLEKEKEEAKAKKAFKIQISIKLGKIVAAIFAFGFVVSLFSESMGETVYIIGMIPLFAIGFIWLKDLSDNPQSSSLNNENSKEPRVKYVRVPESLIHYQNSNYKVVQAVLVRAGFENVNCVGLKDLGLIHIKTPNSVASITVNGVSSDIAGKKFKADADIVISYHSYADLSKTE